MLASSLRMIKTCVCLSVGPLILRSALVYEPIRAPTHFITGLWCDVCPKGALMVFCFGAAYPAQGVPLHVCL